MDEDHPATQPHLSPAEQAAMEEARLKTADDSFVASQANPDATAPASAAVPSLSSAKKVVIQPVNDLSSYSTFPAVPVAAVPSTQSVPQTGLPTEATATQQLGATLAPIAASPIEANTSVVAQSSGYDPEPNSYDLQDSVSSALDKQFGPRVASMLPMLQWFAVILLLFSLYYTYTLFKEVYAEPNVTMYAITAIQTNSPSILCIFYALYFLLGRNLRNMSGALLSLMITFSISFVVLVANVIASNGYGYIVASSFGIIFILLPIAVILACWHLRLRVHVLDDASRNPEIRT